jgi:hypothetical protein
LIFLLSSDPQPLSCSARARWWIRVFLLPSAFFRCQFSARRCSAPVAPRIDLLSRFCPSQAPICFSARECQVLSQPILLPPTEFSALGPFLVAACVSCLIGASRTPGSHLQPSRADAVSLVFVVRSQRPTDLLLCRCDFVVSDLGENSCR